MFTLDNKSKKEIKEAMEKLVLTCQQYRAPVFIWVAMDDNGEETTYENAVFSAKTHGIQLSDDQIRKHILVADGFAVVPPRDRLEIDMGQFMDQEGGKNE